jgi:phospholipid/cholesterol/gamma-HCH transport system ATP-binding protein
LEISQGEILAIMGSSGGGKTTLLRCISRLLDPTEGVVTLDGTDAIRFPDEARAKMGMVFQGAALFDFMTVQDNVLFGPRRKKRMSSREEEQLLASSLEMVGLSPDIGHQLPSELSGGMRKRVGIARAIALQPRVMLYDEPTTGLDPITTYLIDELMVRLARDTGLTTVIVSHDVSSVMRVSHQIAFLHGGELTFRGGPQEFENTEVPAIREIIQKSRTTEFSVSQ